MKVWGLRNQQTPRLRTFTPVSLVALSEYRVEGVVQDRAGRSALGWEVLGHSWEGCTWMRGSRTELGGVHLDERFWGRAGRDGARRSGSTMGLGGTGGVVLSQAGRAQDPSFFTLLTIKQYRHQHHIRALETTVAIKKLLSRYCSWVKTFQSSYRVTTLQTMWNSLTIPWWIVALPRGTRHLKCYLYGCKYAVLGNFSLTRFFPWHLVKSLKFPWQLSNSLTFPGFPDKWSPCTSIKQDQWHCTSHC